MQLARLLYSLSHQQQTGLLFFPTEKRAAIYLTRGWVHAIYAPWDLPSADEKLARVLDEDWATNFDAESSPSRNGACTPFHPALQIRRAVERVARSQHWRARAGQGTVQIALPPHGSCLDVDEKSLTNLLSQPQTVAQIDGARRAAPSRTDRLLDFLLHVDALTFSPPSSHALLEISPGASAEEIRQAYKRLAYALHPDRHPGVTADERRELEDHFARVHAAYRQLLGE